MEGRKAPRDGYRWTCPYCGKSRLNASGPATEKRYAISALRTHILNSDGDGHGSQNEWPDDFEALSLDEYVVYEGGKR